MLKNYSGDATYIYRAGQLFFALLACTRRNYYTINLLQWQSPVRGLHTTHYFGLFYLQLLSPDLPQGLSSDGDILLSFADTKLGIQSQPTIRQGLFHQIWLAQPDHYIAQETLSITQLTRPKFPAPTSRPCDRCNVPLVNTNQLNNVQGSNNQRIFSTRD